MSLKSKVSVHLGEGLPKNGLEQPDARARSKLSLGAKTTRAHEADGPPNPCVKGLYPREPLPNKTWIFVGLGNPGERYEMTRHNMGAIVVKAFCRLHNLDLKAEARFSAYVGRAEISEVAVHALLPYTYMNESGRAVRSYLDYYRLRSQDLVVVVDDADLPFGTFRMRQEGSAGGHNGLKSIEQALGTRDYPRFRIGIGRQARGDLVDHVLGHFTADETIHLEEICREAETILERLLVKSLADVISVVNMREKHETKEPSV